MKLRIPSLVKLPSNRKFRFKPRFYDPVMEDLEERVAQIKEDMAQNKETDASAIRRRISFRQSSKVKQESTTLMIRLVIILVMCGNVFGYVMLGYGLELKLILLSELIIGYVWYRRKKRSS